MNNSTEFIHIAPVQKKKAERHYAEQSLFKLVTESSSGSYGNSLHLWTVVVVKYVFENGQTWTNCEIYC